MPAFDNAKEEAQKVVGASLGSRRPEGLLFRVMGLLSQMNTAANADDTISVDALKDFNGKPKRWQAVAPMTFQDVGGEDLLILPRLNPAQVTRSMRN